MEALLHKLSTMDTKLKFNADYPVHVIKQIKKTTTNRKARTKCRVPGLTETEKTLLKYMPLNN